MKPPIASQLVTLAAACASGSSPAPPSATTASTGPFSSLPISSSFQVPCGVPFSSTTTEARAGHGEGVDKSRSPNDWSKALSYSPVLPLRGGASSDDKRNRNAHENAQAASDSNRSSPEKQAKNASSNQSKNSKKNRSTQSRKREKAASQSKQQGGEKKDEGKTTSNNDASTSNNENSQSYPNQRIVEEIVKQTDYYQILGIPNHKKGSLTKVEIQKAYRKRAVQVHPDKTGGDRRAFDKVAESFDVLSDDSKRELYDRFGKQGLGNGGASASGMPGQFQDIFQSMFQQGGQRQSYGRTRQNYTMRYQIEVTLEELYNGTTQDVLVTAPTTERRRQKSVQVNIPKGSIPGQSIVLSGEMDFANDIPGDLIFVVSQRPHPVFTRKGHDLAMELEISLEEAICGLQREIRHLDGSNLWIASASREGNDAPHIIQTGEVQVLKGRGMPKKSKVEDEYGDLYIQFRVEMPNPQRRGGAEALSNEEIIELGRLLSKLQDGGSNKKKLPKTDDKIHSLCTASSRDFGSASGPVHLEEDEHGHHHEDASPFSSQFFQGASGGSSFYFGSSFGGRSNDDDGNVQCQQM
ncbi:unnamed protein product [Cylindrotheca closterium]|uniref:J domain-containing protein n=1 Tax=Cylindrotheca closterium TaxID=2856 RepID=A0AAD2FG67_9STRA|nr:unnamed protein product [Cylindrotheca closterium]